MQYAKTSLLSTAMMHPVPCTITNVIFHERSEPFTGKTPLSKHGLLELQIIPWTRLNTSFQVKLHNTDNQIAEDSTVKPQQAATNRETKLFWIYPLMLAVELRQPSWLNPMAESAESYFLLDSANLRDSQMQVSYTEAAAQTKFSAEAKKSAALRLAAWVNIARPGPENGPTALYR